MVGGFSFGALFMEAANLGEDPLGSNERRSNRGDELHGWQI